MKFVISGGGIGGLTTALCLLQEGYDVELFEQSNEFSDIGAGIQLGANAVNVLESLGALPSILKRAVQPKRIDVRLFDSGEMLYHSNLGESYLKDYGAPYLHIHRADLQEVLLKALNEYENFQCQLNKRVIGFRERDDKVFIEFADKLSNTSSSADGLIAADGIKSAIRNKITNEHSARWTGSVAWRGTLSTDRLPENFMDRVVTNFVGPNKHMVIYYLRNQRLVNFVGVVANQPWQEESWTAKAPWEELQNDFSGWHPTVEAVINAADKENCYRWALHDHLPLNNWSNGRVTLLGDAAHATLPFMASGAAMAIEDARILTRALACEDSVESAFQLYQQNRVQRTAQVQRYSRHIAKLYKLPYRPLIKMAFKAISIRPNNPDKWLPDYNANTVNLL